MTSPELLRPIRSLDEVRALRDPNPSESLPCDVAYGDVPNVTDLWRYQGDAVQPSVYGNNTIYDVCERERKAKIKEIISGLAGAAIGLAFVFSIAMGWI